VTVSAWWMWILGGRDRPDSTSMTGEDDRHRAATQASRQSG
jgi:hypothetical protein